MKDYHQVLKLVENGRVDFGIVTRSFGMKYGDYYNLKKNGFYFSPIKLRYVFRKGIEQQIISKIDEYLEKMQKDRSSIYYAAMDHWLGGGIVVRKIPYWTKIILYLMVSFLIIFLVINLFLKKRVDEKHEELKSKNIELKLEKSGRQKIQRAFNEASERFKLIFEHTQIGIVLLDENGKIFDSNEASASILHISNKELIGKTFYQLFDDDCLEIMKKNFNKLNNGEIKNFEVEVKTVSDSGIKTWINLIVAVLKKERGGISSICMLENINSRKMAEVKIKKSLKERELLIKEIHSRVQKNLQIIDYILKLQIACIKDEESKKLLMESSDRLQAMSLIHKIMHDSISLYTIDFEKFTKLLVKKYKKLYRIGENQIELMFKIDTLNLDINRSIIVALLINEFISNSLKHGFPHGRRGHLSIILEQKNNQVKLISDDDGIGLPVNFSIEKENTTGMTLISNLSKQLSASINLNTDNGTRIEVEFET
jgi:PAS domain S-box-containing protein